MRAAGESPRARRSSLSAAAASSWARTRALTPAGSPRLGAVMSAVITCGDCPATAASSPVASLALVMSISVGTVTTACRTGQATHRRRPSTQEHLAAQAHLVSSARGLQLPRSAWHTRTPGKRRYRASTPLSAGWLARPFCAKSYWRLPSRAATSCGKWSEPAADSTSALRRMSGEAMQ